MYVRTHRGRNTLRLDTLGKQAILRFRSVPGICAKMISRRKGELSPDPPISSLLGTLAGWLAGWRAEPSYLFRHPARPPFLQQLRPNHYKNQICPTPMRHIGGRLAGMGWSHVGEGSRKRTWRIKARSAPHNFETKLYWHFLAKCASIQEFQARRDTDYSPPPRHLGFGPPSPARLLSASCPSLAHFSSGCLPAMLWKTFVSQGQLFWRTAVLQPTPLVTPDGDGGDG